MLESRIPTCHPLDLNAERETHVTLTVSNFGGKAEEEISQNVELSRDEICCLCGGRLAESAPAGEGGRGDQGTSQTFILINHTYWPSATAKKSVQS